MENNYGEMIERVTRALCISEGIDPDLDGAHIGHPSIVAPCWKCEGLGFIGFARTAIAAIRKPTEAMIGAGNVMIYCDDMACGINVFSAARGPASAECWENMIDAALK